MRAIFVQIKWEMGQAYKVAREAADTIEQMSELYSTSGQYDLLGKFYLEPEQDIGLFVTDKIQTLPGVSSVVSTALPIAVGDMSSSRAAARKLPCLATATTASSSTNPLLYIVTIL